MPYGHVQADSLPKRILTLLLWFVLPLALLVLADRTWMWTKWLRSRKMKSKKILHIINNNKEKKI